MSTFEYVLGIETSCDDTSVAIVRQDGFVVDCLAANQDLVHKPFGGVVPEIASRNHTLQLLPLIDELFARTKMSWAQVNGVAVTSRPGLIGSLLVGVVTAKTLALVYKKPFIGVNHLEAHLLAAFLHDEKFAKYEKLKYPFLALAVSGGHTQLCHVKGLGQYEILGRSVDDAAGEAFDKLAKHMGMGFPGGVLVDREAQKGRGEVFRLPRTVVRENPYAFSFSGLKSAAIRLVNSFSPEELLQKRADICASFQEAVVDSLMARVDLAHQDLRLPRVVITGGVSANSGLRSGAEEWGKNSGVEVFIPPLRYCTDNAAMVAYAGIERLRAGERSEQDLAPSSESAVGDFREVTR